MVEEQIKDFNKAYKKVKSMGFENYFCLKDTTWKEAKENFDKGLFLQDDFSIDRLNYIVPIILNFDKKHITLCKQCGNPWSKQEFDAGFETCEHCAGHCGCNSILEAQH